jgi:hypothetical protein
MAVYKIILFHMPTSVFASYGGREYFPPRINDPNYKLHFLPRMLGSFG